MSMQQPRGGSPSAWPAGLPLFLAALTVGHFVMEFVCVGALFAGGGPDAATVLAYNACAFLVPVAIGAITDERVGPIPLVASGCLVAVAGAGWGGQELGGAVLLGLGNAAFHVAGGSAALRMPRPASAVGVFVGSGAIGLALGVRFAPEISVSWRAVAVVGCLVVVAAARATATRLGPAGVGARVGQVVCVGIAEDAGASPGARVGPAPGAVGGFLVWGIVGAVGLGLVRTALVTATPAEWKQGTGLVLGAACAAAVGKAAGGLIGDRCGWLRTALVAVTVAGLAVWAPPTSAVAGLMGIAAVNVSVPLVLAALAARVPGHEGLAFGVGQAIQFLTVIMAGTSWSRAAILLATACCLGLAVLAFGGDRRFVRSRPIVASS